MKRKLISDVVDDAEQTKKTKLFPILAPSSEIDHPLGSSPTNPQAFHQPSTRKQIKQLARKPKILHPLSWSNQVPQPTPLSNSLASMAEEAGLTTPPPPS